MSIAHKIEQQGLRKGWYEEDLKIARRMLARGADCGYMKDVIGLSDQDLLNLED
ncbi:conserved hypothetical protein [Rickettsiella grylli]|uniref:Transposase n=2 Tax=Rickettsiella grylli TaxID=59196 RepID=A8PPL6_9COXI|nr:conserved hypothetical protein [Rickettsiella grylli]